MKREIKFRAFIKNEIGGFMIPSDDSDFFIVSNGNGFVVYDENKNTLEDSEFELMQFTGLKDQKGVDIYEGDILKYKEWKNNSDELAFKTNYIVCFEQLKWILKHTSGRYQVTVQQHSGLDSQSLNNDGCKARNFKVIGNIYKNPELLK